MRSSCLAAAAWLSENVTCFRPAFARSTESSVIVVPPPIAITPPPTFVTSNPPAWSRGIVLARSRAVTPMRMLVTSRI